MEAYSVRTRYQGLDAAAEQTGYSRVTIIAGQDDNGDIISYTAGNDSGKTLEIQNDWGSQEMANRILAKIRGYQYQPYAATGAMLDPAAEIGDAVSVGTIYSGVFHRKVRLSRLMRADIRAALETDTEHDIETGTAQERQFRRYSRLITEAKTLIRQNSRKIALEAAQRNAADQELRSTLQINAAEIAAKVGETGGSAESFSWSLKKNGARFYSNNRLVLGIDASGANITGQITATGGQIGGFTLNATSLYNNINRFGGEQTQGVYLGTDGLQLGQNFKVDSLGYLSARGGTFSGSIYCDRLYVANGSGGYDAITTESVSRSLAGGAAYGASGWGNYSAPVIASGASWGNNFNLAVTRGSAYTPNYFKAAYGDFASVGVTTQLTAKNFWLNNDFMQFGTGGTRIYLRTGTFKNASGQNVTIKYLGAY